MFEILLSHEADKYYKRQDRDTKRMARELGMNPKRFGKIANEKQEPWKAPLPAFIEHIYLERFGRERPAEVRPIEEIWKTSEKKRQDRKKRKQQKREGDQSAPKSIPDTVQKR